MPRMASSYAIDLHVHSREGTNDAASPANDVVAAAVRANLAGLCITGQIIPDELRQQSSVTQEQVNSDLRRGFDVAFLAAEQYENGPRIYFGLEYRIPKTVDDVLILGIEPEVLAGIDLVRADPWDVRRFVVERGGLLCAAHPYRHRSHGAPFGGRNMVDAVEVLNGRQQYNNRNDLAMRWCQKVGLVALAGSDAHQSDEVGEVVTCLKSCPTNTRDLGGLLRQGAISDLCQRNRVMLGLQSCRFNGLFIEDEMRHTARQNLTAFEVFFDGFLPSDIDIRSRKRIALMASGMGLQMSVLAPPMPLAGDDDVELLDEFITFAHDVGALLLIVPALTVQPSQRLLEQVQLAAQQGIQLAVGNAYTSDNPLSPKQLAKHAELMPEVQVALDIGYAHLYGDAAAYTRELLEQLEATGRRVVHLQLHDNDGQKNGHLSLGDGSLPLQEVLQLLFATSFHGSGIIEHWRDPGRDAERVLQIARQIERPMSEVDLQMLAAT